VRGLPGGVSFRDHMNTLLSSAAQLQAMAQFFDQLADAHERLPEPALAEAQAAPLAANDDVPPNPTPYPLTRAA
jgi:tRNA-dihydrouridine synthase B